MASPMVPAATTSLVSTAVHSPASPMPEYRAAAFARTVGARLRMGAQYGIPFPTMMATLIQEQQAMAVALQNPAFIDAAATFFQQAMAMEQPNPAYALPIAEARREIQSILHNRVRDAQQFAALLTNPAFMMQASQAAAQPTPAPQPYVLPPNKAEEIVRRLVQPADPEGPEPAVHVAASALGQREVHQALSRIFQPDGVLRGPLMQALRAAQPGVTDEALHQQASAWLSARQGPAQAVADGLSPDGSPYAVAMQQSESLQQQLAVPATQIAVPATHIPLRPHPDLAMDNL